MFTGLLTGVFKENAKGVSTRKRKLPKKEEFLFQVAKGCRKIMMRNWKPRDHPLRELEVLNEDEGWEGNLLIDEGGE